MPMNSGIAIASAAVVVVDAVVESAVAGEVSMTCRNETSSQLKALVDFTLGDMSLTARCSWRELRDRWKRSQVRTIH